MSIKEGTISEGMKKVLAEDHIVKQAVEMADKQMFNEVIQNPKPKNTGGQSSGEQETGTKIGTT